MKPRLKITNNIAIQVNNRYELGCTGQIWTRQVIFGSEVVEVVVSVVLWQDVISTEEYVVVDSIEHEF